MTPPAETASNRLDQMPEQLPEVAPLDEYNRQLVANVHPPDWQNPQPSGRYNLVVVGAGSAGLVTAAGAAGLGAKVALVERELMGGDCLNVGCVPSKALLRCARAAADVRDGEQFGVEADEMAVNFPAVMERMRRLRAKISPHDSARRFADELKVDVYLGDARFSDPSTIEVDGQTLGFSKAVIATGTRASKLPVPGLEEAGYLTNETVFTLTELPRRLAVIGAGPLGCELAQAFARFGSKVYLIEKMHGIMPPEDDEAAEIVKQSLLRDGIQIVCCGKNLQVARDENGKRLSVHSHGEDYELNVDEILVGAGRTPNVESLDLQAAGIEFDKPGVTVSDRLQTTNRDVYAAGDVCSKYKFTHMADALARIVIRNALFFGRSKASQLIVPWCTYTDPEIAHVGLYPDDAEEKGIAVETFRVPLGEVDRGVLDGEEEGLLKVHTKKGTKKILGATLVARHAGEMISEITLAMVSGAGLTKLAETIHPYPTQAEAIKHVADQFNRTRLTPWVRKLFETLLRWRR